MSSIPIQFQVEDEKPMSVNLPLEFNFDDFKKAAADASPYQIFLHMFICHGQELNLNDETEFNKQKTLISPGTTIFILTEAKCFLSDTLILRSDLSEVPISSIQSGDALMAFTESGEIVTTVVENIFIHEVDQYVEAHFGQKILHVTHEHPFFIGNGGFLPLSKLCINDCVYSLIDGQLQTTPLTHINTIIAPVTRVYDLCTAHPHTYFANGMAVHNKRGILFVDLDKKKDPKRIPWNTSAPKWRVAWPGICLEGECTNKSCAAHKQLVVINIGIKEKFDVLSESFPLSKCPVCSKYVEPITCAFNNCSWQWTGIIQPQPGMEPRKVSGEWKQADDAYHRFDHSNDNDNVNWLQLVLEAKPRRST